MLRSASSRLAASWRLAPACARNIGDHAPKARPHARLPRKQPLTLAPQLADSLVAFTAVTPEGRRYPVVGRIGTSLASALGGSSHAEVASHVGILSPRYGAEAHVRVAHEFMPRLPPLDEDAMDALNEIADDVRADSRLASTVRREGFMGAGACLKLRRGP